MKSNFLLTILLSMAVLCTGCEEGEDFAPTLDVDALSSFAIVSTSAATSTDSSTGRPCTPGSQDRKRRLAEVAVADLPSAITSYITANIAGATIERAGKTNGGDFIVIVKKADATKLVLTFNASGEFVSKGTHQRYQGTRVEVGKLPAAITSYITANYPGTTIEKAAQGKEGRYVVAIKRAEDSMLGLAFDSTGTFITELALDGKFGCRKEGKPKKR